MILSDRYGNALSTTVPAARDAYDRGMHLFLGAEYGAVDAFAQAVSADPDFALGYAGCARAAMMAGDMPGARAAFAEAEALAPYGTARERAHIGVLGLLFAGRPAACREAVRAHVRDHPRDALIAQLCTNVFGLIGFSGEIEREADLLAFTEALLPEYGEDWWMQSMHALSLCETGHLDASATLMERSLATNPRNANGAHFKAHRLYEEGRTAEGRAYLAAWLPDYDGRSVLHGHLSWHGALWALHDGDAAAMWDAVDAGIGPGSSKGLPINVLTDTAALLFRAELAGIAVDPERWRALSAYALRHFPEPGQSFADIHAALAHAMAGDGAPLARIAETATGFAGDLVRPVARAWGAIARADWEGARADLAGVMDSAVRLGGSRAQRDLLDLTYAHVLLRLGRADAARKTLAARRPVLAEAPPLAALT